MTPSVWAARAAVLLRTGLGSHGPLARSHVLRPSAAATSIAQRWFSSEGPSSQAADSKQAKPAAANPIHRPPEKPAGQQQAESGDSHAAASSSSGSGSESGGDTSTSQAEESAAQATAKAQAEAAQAANPWVLLEKLQKDAGLPSFKPLVLNLHDAAPIWASAGRWVLGRLSSALHRTYIETEFNDEEFLEGCQDAYYMVQQLFGAGDFEELKPMVASSVLKAFREVHEEYAAHKLKFSLQVEEVTGAALEDISWWPRQKMAERHDEVSTEAPLGAVGSAGDSGPDVGAGAAAATAPLPGQKVRAKSKYYDMWLVMGVRFTGRTKSTTVDETGKVLSETIDNRSHRWQFAKGPLPTYLPVITLDMPWVVVNVGL